MGENTAIEWASHTFNPWVGCTKVSPGCKFCYAEHLMDHRMGRAKWGAGQPRQRTSLANRRKPIAWDKAAAKAGIRQRVFSASLSDVFDVEAPQEWRDELWALIAKTSNLDWLLLTKRPQNVMGMVPASWKFLFPKNVWMGVSVENQDAANERIPILLDIPACTRFLSCEPLLGPVDLTRVRVPWGERNALDGAVEGRGMTPSIDWVIVGGESGANARPMHPEWARSLRDQCLVSGTRFFFKQWGEWGPSQIEAVLNGEMEMSMLGKKSAGRLLDGELYSSIPRYNEAER